MYYDLLIVELIFSIFCYGKRYLNIKILYMLRLTEAHKKNLYKEKRQEGYVLLKA